MFDVFISWEKYLVGAVSLVDHATDLSAVHSDNGPAHAPARWLTLQVIAVADYSTKAPVIVPWATFLRRRAVSAV